MEPRSARDLRTVDVVLALRNDIQRYGVERVLGEVDAVGSISHHRDLAVAAHAVDPSSILVVALREVDEPICGAIAEAALRRVRVLLLVDIEEASTFGRIGKLAHLPTVGFLSTADLSTATLATALDASNRGEMPMPPQLARAVLTQAQTGPEASRLRRPRLTPRERQVLALLVEGLSNRQIARRLGVSEHGAKRHVANILGKLDCTNRTRAVATALRYGLCSTESGLPAMRPAG